MRHTLELHRWIPFQGEIQIKTIFTYPVNPKRWTLEDHVKYEGERAYFDKINPHELKVLDKKLKKIRKLRFFSLVALADLKEDLVRIIFEYANL
jgi:hypothetical protein